MMLRLNGYRVVASPNLTTTETREVKRTWKERLFSLPWRPFKATRSESYQVPYRNVLIDRANQVMYAHPVVVKKIAAATGGAPCP